MKATKITTGDFTRLGNGAFQRKFGTILQALSQHQDVFGELPVSIEHLEEIYGRLVSATDAAVFGSRNDRNQRNLERSIATDALMKTQAHVSQVASLAKTEVERNAIVELAKFAPRKKRTPPEIRKPAMPRAEISKTVGLIRLKWKAQKGVRSWLLQHAEGSVTLSSNWRIIKALTRTSFDATGLPSGYHSFRVVGVYASGESAPSDPVTEWAR